jgi:hypothetical protein
MKSIKKISIIASFVCLLIVFGAFTISSYNKGHKNLSMKQDDKGFAVVELFTSEGCSSCPPADDLLARVQKESILKHVYILAYHVDYWDHLGWKDTYSDAEYSKRQTMYGDWLQLRSLYTPQIIVNGKTEFVGSREGALTNAIAAGLGKSPASDLTIKSSILNKQLIVEYQTNSTLLKSNIVVALVQKSGQSKVQAGENSGRTLTHVQIVRKLQIETLSMNTGKISLAIPKDYDSNEWEVISFVQNNSNGEILAAAKSELLIDAIK